MSDEEHPYRPSLPVVSEVDGKQIVVDTPGACPTCRWSYGSKNYLKCELKINGRLYCNSINEYADCEHWQPETLERRVARKGVPTRLGWSILIAIAIDILIHILF